MNNIFFILKIPSRISQMVKEGHKRPPAAQSDPRGDDSELAGDRDCALPATDSPGPVPERAALSCTRATG